MPSFLKNCFVSLINSKSLRNVKMGGGKFERKRALIEQLEDRQLLAVTTELAAVPVADQAVYEASALSEDLTIDLAELAAAEHVVTTTEDVVDPNDGVLSLREALAAAQDGDSIVFSPELGENIVVAVTEELVVSSTITIDGKGQVALDGGNQTHIMKVDGGSKTQCVQLLGLTFQNAQAGVAGEGEHLDGGAIYVANTGYVNIANSVFRNNSTQAYGGAIASHGNLTLSNVEFYNNQARRGGAIVLVEGDVSGDNVVFHDNTATENGGAVFVQYGFAEFNNSSFYANAAADKGGAIYNHKFGLVVSNSVFYGNTASEGGAVYDRYGLNETLLRYCTIAGNSAKRGGGVYSYDLLLGVGVYNTIVTNNFAFDSANFYGLAIYGSNNWFDKDVMFVEAPQFRDNGTLRNLDTLDLRLLSTSAAAGIGAYEYQGGDLGYEVNVDGKIRIGTDLTASALVDGQKVENVRYYWYVSDTADGELSLIEGADEETYRAPNEFLGKYLTAVAATDTYAAMTTVGPLEKAKLCKRVIKEFAAADKIVLSWTEVPRAGSYRVQYRVTGTEEWTEVVVNRAAFELTGLTPDTSYDFRVKALSADNQEYYLNGDYSNLTVKTLPEGEKVSDFAPVKGVMVDQRGYDYIDLSWLGSDSAQGCWVEVFNADRTQLLNSYWTDKESVRVNDLTPLTDYSIDVITESNILGRSEAVTVKVSTNGKKLVIPSVSAEFTAAAAELQWNAIANAQGYVVTYRAQGETSFKTYGTVDGTSCSIEDLDLDTVYQFRVKAIGDGYYSNSDNGSAYALAPAYDPTTAYAPEKVVVEDAAATSILLSWSKGYNANAYRVVVKDVDGAVVQTVNTVQTSIKVTGLTAQTAYSLEIYSVSYLFGNSADFAALSVTTDVVKKLPKPVVTTEYQGNGTYRVSWNEVAGAAGYRLQIKEADNPEAAWITFDNLSVTSGNFNNLEAGGTYLIRVRANGDNIDYLNSDNGLVTVTVPLGN